MQICIYYGSTALGALLTTGTGHSLGQSAATVAQPRRPDEVVRSHRLGSTVMLAFRSLCLRATSRTLRVDSRGRLQGETPRGDSKGRLQGETIASSPLYVDQRFFAVVN